MKADRNIIRKIGFLLMIVCGISLFCSFSPSKSDIDGYPTVYGNEPFTFLGIMTVPKKEGDPVRYYRIICSEEEEKALRELQGTVVHIRGKIVTGEKAIKEYGPEVLDDGVIVLSSWNKK
jgi:hypothetical protein